MKSDDEIQKSQKAKNRAKRIQVLPNTQKVGRFNPSFPTFPPPPLSNPGVVLWFLNVGNTPMELRIIHDLTRIIQDSPKDCETAHVKLSEVDLSRTFRHKL